MATIPELEGARVTEVQVRMDCNGCVNKIKRAVHGVEGVYDVLVNFPEQKLTVVGRADPELIVKAIRKLRKTATIPSQTEAGEEPPPPPADPPAEEAPEPELQPPVDPPAPEPAAEAPSDPPPEPQPVAPEGKAVYDFPMMHHYPYDYSDAYTDRWRSNYHDAPYYTVAQHSYSAYVPPSTVSQYADGYAAVQSLADGAAGYYEEGRYDRWRDRFGGGGNGGSNSISSMFSDENPNACSIA